LSVGSVRRVHSVLHRALAQAMRWDWIWVNPAANASPPASLPSGVRPPTTVEVQALLAHAASVDAALHAFLVLAVSTAARRSQLLGLRWFDVDVTRGAIAFRRGLVEGPDGPRLVATKTRRSYRVELDDASRAVLVTHRERASVTPSGDGFVFCFGGDSQRPWKPNWVTKRFIDVRRSAGLAHFRLHDLRHFMATGMLELGVPVPIVAARLCHARASTTLNVYAHAVPSGDRAAAELLAAWLRPPAVSGVG
jgi:integrase